MEKPLLERRVTLQITGLASAISIALGGGAGTIFASSQVTEELKTHEGRIDGIEKKQEVLLVEIEHLKKDVEENDSDRKKDLDRIEQKIDRLLTGPGNGNGGRR